MMKEQNSEIDREQMWILCMREEKTPSKKLNSLKPIACATDPMSEKKHEKY